MRWGWLLVLGAALAAGCSRGGGGGGASSALGAASVASSAPRATTPAAPLRGQDFTGTWDVKGTDPTLGPYAGTAVVASSGQGFSVVRLVTFARKLPDGRDLLQVWNAGATRTAAGLAVSATLRVAEAYKRVGSQVRTPADMQPVAVSAVLAGANGVAPANIPVGTTLSGTFSNGAAETWTYSGAPAPPAPLVDRRSVALHSVDPTIRQTSFALYASYFALPEVAPYASRPEFQAAQHFVPVDHTAKSFYQLRGPRAVVLVDKKADAIATLEETHRADAFSYKLYEKANRFDSDMKALHVLPCGMIAAVDTASGQRFVSGDGALHQGVWAVSQAFRFQVTGDPDALANLKTAVSALCILVEISPNKAEFARAIQDGKAPAGWQDGAGAFANVAWLPGGNNDMLHGIECGFFAADRALPASDPLRARIGACAASLLQNVSIARSGTHEVFLSGVAWRTTHDPAWQARYQSALTGLANLAKQQWIALGDGIFQVQGVTDWSGHHLGEVDMIGLRLLGGAAPSAAEQTWRDAANRGARAAFTSMATAREGLLAVLAAAAGAPGARDVAKDVLEEIPYPKPTADFEVDRRVAAEFCMSPYPANPWYVDWLTNPGREQAIEGLPHFHRGTADNYWNEGTLDFRGFGSIVRFPGQDYLLAYWLARANGLIGPND
jgi:hypothetical protein